MRAIETSLRASVQGTVNSIIGRRAQCCRWPVCRARFHESGVTVSALVTSGMAPALTCRVRPDLGVARYTANTSFGMRPSWPSQISPGPPTYPRHTLMPTSRAISARPGVVAGIRVSCCGRCCRVFLIAVLSPAVAIAFYQYEQADRVFRGVSALGVDLSGRSRGEAEQIVAARTAELTARPILVRAGDTQWRTDWRKLGLDLPAALIVDRAMAVGRQGTILDRLYAQARALRSGTAITVEETLDESAVRAFVAYASAQIDRPVRNARLEMLPDLTFELTTAQDGRQLDQEEGVRLLLAAAQTGAEDVELPVTVPDAGDDRRDAARRQGKGRADTGGPVDADCCRQDLDRRPQGASRRPGVQRRPGRANRRAPGCREAATSAGGHRR